MSSSLESIGQRLEQIGSESLAKIAGLANLEALEQLRVALMGKKGAMSEVLQGLGSLTPAERPQVGALANEWKRKLEAALAEKKEKLEGAALEQKLSREQLDITAPSLEPHRGSLHILTQTTRKIIRVFSRLGFSVTTGPEAETDYLNFEAVNIPADHPARDMQDTFFLGPGVVLRTHTSSVQMRAMREQAPPIRILCPGAVYRSDSDATHTPMFHQVEGLWIDKDVKMSDLKGTLAFFAREMFGTATKIRLRPSYFPFVEPGAEVDVSCFQCGNSGKPGCRICKGTGWVEILGAGMVHPRLFEMAGYPAGQSTGFAFGMGVERISMLLHEVPDLRLMFQDDPRFLSQF